MDEDDGVPERVPDEWIDPQVDPDRPPAPVAVRVLRARWIALGGAIVWMTVMALQFIGTTTDGGTDPRAGSVRTQTIYAAHPVAVVLYYGLLGGACAITGVSFVRRVRQRSEAWSGSGCASAGVIGLLGLLSLATVGLSLAILATLLFVVARPIRSPRPIPGDPLVAPD